MMELRWWGGTAVSRDGYRVVLIRLPSYGMGYNINCDDLRWGQRAILYHGKRGLSLTWIFTQKQPESESDA